MTKEDKITGWIARDECGYLFLHKRKPKRMISYWEDEPVEVELTIKTK